MHICKGKEEGPEDVDRLRHEESGLNIAALAVLFCFLVLCVWRGVCLSLFYFFVLFVFLFLAWVYVYFGAYVFCTCLSVFTFACVCMFACVSLCFGMTVSIRLAFSFP